MAAAAGGKLLGTRDLAALPPGAGHTGAAAASGGWLLCPVRPAGGAPPHARAHRPGGGPAGLLLGLRGAGGGSAALPASRRAAGAAAELVPLAQEPSPPARPAA